MSAYDDDLLDEEEEEMPMTERDLADDAQWKIIQKNTFSRWANEHLKTINKNITNLETDLSDGLRLVGLVEVLSGKKFKFVNKRPNFRTQKLENVTMALEFLERDEGIRIVNIDSGDIVDGKLKLILGLIWTLILHYSISMPMWEGEEPQPQEGGPTPKQRLLNWIGAKLPDLPIKNFTTDWNDGKAIGALVDAVAPGLCPDWEDWDPKKAKKNAKEAMDAAEEWLDIPQLIRPEEMTNPKVDDLSMMTYLSQFPKAKLKPGAPLRPKMNASRVRAYGPGVEPKGNSVNIPAKFTVETFSAGSGTVEVTVIDPKGKNVKCEVVFNNDRNQTYSCVYIPPIEGDYRVIVKFGEKEINKSPFKVNVGPPAGDPSKVTAAGPGLEKTGVCVSKKTHFEVFTKDAGKGTVDVVIVDPNGKNDTVKPTIKPASKDGVYYVEYTATIQGLYSISILFNGQQIPNSPYGVNVGPALNPKAVYATGRGIQPRGVRVKQTAEFKIHTKDAGVAEVKVQIIGPGGVNLDCKVTPSQTEEGVYNCVYIPPKVGQYVINITFGGQHITKSPFRVDVGPEKFSRVVAFGPGLESGVVNQPACFTVETNGETGALGFSIEGPSQAKIDCKDNGDGSADITYWPTMPGEYAIHILVNEEDIPQAPYMAQIQPATTAFDASKVIAKGPGLEPTGVLVNKPAEFTVDAKKAGKATLNITCIDENYKAVEVIVKDNKDGTYSCKYTPKSPVRHTIIITWGTIGIPKSPFRVYVSEPVNPGNVKVFGPGVEKGVKTFVLTHFTVDCKTAGPGDVAVGLTDEKGQDVPVNTIDNHDGTFTIEYEPKTPGTYTVSVYFAEKPVPKTPIKVKVESSIDLSKVTVKGLETPITLGEKRTITVVTKLAIKKDAHCTIVITMPSGKTLEMTLTLVQEGYTTVFVPTEVGQHKVTVTYATMPVPKSPFTVMVEIPVDVGKVKVTGLDSPIEVGETRPIDILTKEAGKSDAPCKVQATGPKGDTKDLPTEKTPEGYKTTYAPLEVGPHKVKVEYAGKELPKSPYPVEVKPKTKDIKDAPKETPVTVKGLETPITVGEKRPITVVSNKPDAPCKVTATNPKGKPTDIPTKKIPEGHEALFAPLEEGPYKVKVEHNGKEVPQSPFSVEVKPKFDISKVQVKGLETPIKTGDQRPIDVITKSTGKPDAPCKVTSSNPQGKSSDLPTKKTPEGYQAIFAPLESGPHVVKVEVDNKEVPKSPFKVPVEPAVDVSKVKVKGLEKPIQLGEVRPVTINTASTGKPDAPCTVMAKGPTTPYQAVPAQINEEGYVCSYKPKEAGPNFVKVQFAEKDVPGSPFQVKVEPAEPTVDVAKVQIKGLERPIEVGEPRPISINTASTGKPDAPCRVLVKSPQGQLGELPTHKTPEGYGTTFAPLEPGPHVVSVQFANQEVPKSPFPVNVEPKANVGAVTVKGLETPIEVGEPRPISINTASTGKPDAPCRVLVKTPQGQLGELPTHKTPEGYGTTFAPLEPGPHVVSVQFANQEVPKSPFPVNVEPKANINAVTVKGLETPIEVGEPRPISINTASTGKPDAPCRVIVATPDGKFGELPTQRTPEGYATTFAPLEPGPHQVSVTFANQEVPRSPFPVQVEPRPNVNAVTVRGLETPIEVGEARPVLVQTASTGKPDAPCRVTATNPKGQVFELPAQKTPEGYQTVFAPLEPGPHKVNVNFAGKEVPKSPFNVTVEPKVDIAAVEVIGLETPIKVGEPRPVTIMTSTTGKPDAPCRVLVTKPTGQTMELPTRKIPEGYTATLAPQEVGPHKVNVEFNGKEVPKSPFSVMAEPAIDFNKVKVTGLEKPIEVGEIRPVTVDTAHCGVVDAPCQVTSTNPAGQVREVPLKKTPTGYVAQFAPLEEGPHLVAVKYDNKEVPKSPFPVEATPAGPPASKVKVYGPGLENGMATKPCQFTIDTREVTKPGGIGVTVEGPAESKIECRDNQDGTCEVTYFPTIPGDYNINVTYADEHIPKSPFTAKIVPSGDIDVSGVKAHGPGLEPNVFLDSPTGFTVDAKSVAPNGEGKVRAIVTSPSGQKTESLVKNNKDGTYDVLYTPYEQGPNTLDITYENCPIPQSPVKVDAAPGSDASRVKAYGPGLEGGVTDAKQTFTVDVRGAGQGGLALAIDGPAETQINCKDNRDGTCEVEYLPVKKGEYDITVKFADQHVPGSPFKVPVKDTVNPSKVKCYGPGLDSNLVKAHEPATFTVDSTEAGEAPLEVTYTDSTGAKRPADIKPIEPGKTQVTYMPVDEGKCKVEVNYANQAVPNSPFNVNVQPGVDASKVRLSGDGVQPTVLASMPVQFVIDTRDAGIAELDVVIQRPDGTYIRPSITDNGDGTFTVRYTPEDCGPYNISITFGGKPVPNTPIRTTAIPTGDASKCRITEGLQQTIPVEKETVISVDASQAGTGKVTCRIRSPTGAEIDIDIVENVDGTFSILFTPAFPGDYSISIKFGGQSIPEGEYIIQVGEDLITADTVDSTHAAPGAGVFQPQEFVIPVGPIFNFVTAYIIMPSGKKAYPKIEDNKDGTVTVRYQPQETGLHELHLCYNQQEVPGSPFQFHVDAINSGFVTAYGPGLSHGVVNQPAEFTIVTKDAGAGGLSLAIEGPSKTEIKCKDNEDGTCTVTYVPTAPGEYNITVKFADKNISGSPFIAKVTAGEPKQKAQIGRSSEVSLKITETDITNLTASIRSPSGQEEPCMLKRLPNGHLGISFTPRETGEHLVNVFRDGQHISNSPFKIIVGESELGNASKVKVYGKGLEEGMANEVNEFIVDTRNAGYGGLSLSIEGPSKADIECHDNEDGTCRVTYKPTEPGTYIINIKFADEHVPSSPFKVKIGGEPSERITERIMRHREAADVTHVGSECELSLKIPVSFLMRMTGYVVSQQQTTQGTSPFDMTASVTSPNGVTELCDVVNLDDCHYSIKFVPKEMGIHTVSVKHKDMHIPGSPFQFTVGPIAGGGAHKVHAAGLGLVRGEVDQPNEFNIYTREAGAGGLSIAVEGPSKAEVDFEDRKDGSCGVTYSVTEPGEYLISIKFNDEHIPDSPFRVPITPSIGDARKISVSALQHKGLTIGKPCAFVVNFNGAPKGKLQARVVSPSGAEDNALVQEIDDGEYAVRFIPRENGPHLVYVSFDGCQIPDSPFRIQVGTVHADPGMVQAYGEGLKTGKTGQTSKFIINTVNAGSGALAVTVEGPSKVKLECTEVDEGYEFTYTPTAPGDYLITIKYAGTNIAGSPYKARVEGQGRPTGFQEQASVVVETVTKTSVMSKFASIPPFQSDASKVVCDGNGLKKGYRNKQCTFNVDTSQAGNNMLFIGMIGPKGPCEELCVKHNPGLPYKITYLVKERGDYMLAVKWGEEHIPGSPFYVRVD